MDLPPDNAVPSEHQRRCIERMVQTKKFNIAQNLLAWKIHFAYRDALPYVHDPDSNEVSAMGLDVFAPFRLYSTFNNDQRDCLASLADVPFRTVQRWIHETVSSPTRLPAPLPDVNAYRSCAVHNPLATERSEIAGLFDTYASHQLITKLWRPGRVKVEKGYFKQDCPTCFEKGFDPKSKKQLRKHLKMDKHSKEYKLKSTLEGLPDRYHCCNTNFDDEDIWANHVVDFHCRSSDMCASAPLSRTRSFADVPILSDPGSSSGRYAEDSSYQGTSGSGVTRNTSSSSTGSRRCSDVSNLYERSPKHLATPGSLENVLAQTSQPHVHLEPSYLPRNVASMSLPSEQLPFAVDSFGNYLLDGSYNNVLRTHADSLVSAGYAGPIPIVIGQPLFAYEDSGKIHNYWYGTTIV